jgi:hypothetical protein
MMETVLTGKRELIDKYIEFYKTFGRFPKDAMEFATYLEVEDNEFLKSFDPLADIVAYIWEGYFDKALEQCQGDPAFESYSCREIYLSLLYNVVAVANEEGEMNRKMVNFTHSLPSAPKELKRFKANAASFFREMISAGQVSGEIADRPLVNFQYNQWAWWGLLFVLFFWKNDKSKDNESTDVAIEKTAHLIFDMLNPNAMDSSIQFFTFLFKEGFK